ncbi:L28 family ribosomal protein [Streptomyces sp. NPDC048516]|uniref:L28 family ribosomal protein n=1 Tax=Streptomyces sp. NPDC048516 TaxID=3365565 RepID=UPI0037188563
MAMVSIIDKVSGESWATMSAHCRLEGAKPGFGRAVSRSRRRTSREFGPSAQPERYRLASGGRHIRLVLSVKAIKAIKAIKASKTSKAIKVIDAIGVGVAMGRTRVPGGKADGQAEQDREEREA